MGYISWCAFWSPINNVPPRSSRSNSSTHLIILSRHPPYSSHSSGYLGVDEPILQRRRRRRRSACVRHPVARAICYSNVVLCDRARERKKERGREVWRTRLCIIEERERETNNEALLIVGIFRERERERIYTLCSIGARTRAYMGEFIEQYMMAAARANEGSLYMISMRGRGVHTNRERMKYACRAIYYFPTCCECIRVVLDNGNKKIMRKLIMFPR